MQAKGVSPKIISMGVRIRTKLFSLPYGDQGLLVKKQAFR